MLLVRKIRSSNSWTVIVILFVLICVFQVCIFVTQFNSMAISEQDNILRGVNLATQSLESKQKLNELQERIYDLLSGRLDKHEPSTEYEQIRRRVHENTQESWNYFSSELNKIKRKVSIDQPELIDEISNVLELGAEQKRSLISDMDRMRMIDGYEEWRHAEAKSLSDLVQRRLHHLQNPKDCKNARKLVCRLNMKCGYGCQLHHITYCFILAYATERTFILKSKGWRYHKAGWEDIFHPVSEKCMNIDPITRPKRWPGQNDTQVLDLPIGGTLVTWPKSLPLAIPADLAPRLIRLNGDPSVWWVGQFLKFLLRTTGATQEMLETGIKKLGFKKPIVGVHIRRTDKIGTESVFHTIEEYMTHVEDYFLQLEMNGTKVKRRVFLASDEAHVIDEARTKYQSYEIIGDSDVARMAGESKRYTDSSLNGIILDIHMLSLCDYVVCTFSSNICRVAYEIMQTMHPDASDRVKSVDDLYFYAFHDTHNRVAVLAHHPRHHDEIYLRPGDQINFTSNHWDGYLKGKNTRTNQVGLFLSFKVKKKVETVEAPVFPYVK